MTNVTLTTAAPEPHRSSRKTGLLSLALIASIGTFLLASMSSWRHSEFLGYAIILVGSVLGIAIARSMGMKTLTASILGGAAGCAIVLGVTFFLQPLLIPPEPGTVYK